MSTKTAVVSASTQALYDQFHFAPAIRSGDTLYCSGTIGTEAGGRVSDDPETQFARAFENLKEVLDAAGASFDDVVEMTTFHVGLQKHLGTFMKVRDRYVREPWPAWTAIGISELAVPGALVEIKVTARL